MPTLPRVLIIHSDPTTRNHLRWLLHLHAGEVAEAAGGVEALTLLRDWRPTVVVMDLHLRGLPTGEVLLRWMHERDPRLPVVIYTDPQTAERAHQTRGVTDVVVTDVVVQGELRLHVLLAAVQSAHDGYSSNSPGRVAAARPAVPPARMGCRPGGPLSTPTTDMTGT